MWEERCLVDGGVLNNLPIDVMSLVGGGYHTIAVDVSQQAALEFSTSHSTVVSGWQLLRRRINPFLRAERDLYIGDMIARAVSIADARAHRTSRAETPVAALVNLPVGQYRTLDFES